MSKRLQVLLSEEEYRRLHRRARTANLTVGAWVRQVLRKADQEVSRKSASEKLRAIQKASKQSFPVGDIEEVLAQIESGYLKQENDSD